MTTMLIGGSGFIGRRLTAALLARGEDVVCADLAPAADQLAGVRFVRSDITRFDSVIEGMIAVRPDRVINLAYSMNMRATPHSVLPLNVVGMDNFFEAARIADIPHVLFSSSLAVNGRQIEFGDDHAVNEEDAFHGARGYAYAAMKVFNEYQARDYREKHGMRITSIRPANVTGHDKVFGSSDHVQVITEPANGRPVRFPYADTMRNIVYVDDAADIFATVALGNPQQDAYNTGGASVSLQGLADLVRERVPGADIEFDREHGGKDECTNYVIDNSRLQEEFGIAPRTAEACVDAIIENVRRGSVALSGAGAA